METQSQTTAETATPATSFDTMPGLGTVTQALEEAATRFGTLGRLVSWKVPTDAVVPVETIRRLLDAAGLSFIALPEVTQAAAIQKSLKNLGEAGLVEEIAKDSHAVVYALMRRDPDREQMRMRYREGFKVAYYPKGVPEAAQFLQTGPDPLIFFAEDGDSAEAEARIKPLIERYKVCYTARDITGHILGEAIYRAMGIPWIERGGVYFVPATNLEMVNKLRAFMAALAEEMSEETGTPQRYALRAVPLPATLEQEDQDDLGSAALEALMSELDGVASDLDQAASRDRENAESGLEYDARSEGRAITMRNKSMDQKMDDLRAVLEKANLYCAMSSLNLEEVRTRVERLQRKATSLRRQRGQGVEAPIDERAGRLDEQPVQTQTRKPRQPRLAESEERAGRLDQEEQTPGSPAPARRTTSRASQGASETARTERE